MGAAPEDFARFCRAEHPRLVGALTLLTGDRMVAEELAQETLVRVSARWGRVRQLESPGGWAHRVAINLARSRWRRRLAERRAHVRRGPDPVVTEDPDAAEAETVRAAVAALPERQRTAIVLRYFLDLSAAEAAERMGTSDTAVRALTSRAASTLRERLGRPIRLDEEESADVV